MVEALCRTPPMHLHLELCCTSGLPTEPCSGHLTVEDVTEADAESQPLVRCGFRFDGHSPFIDLEVPLPALDARRDYALAVHLDLNGSGQLTSGDYLNVESIPLDARRQPATLDVRAPLIRI